MYDVQCALYNVRCAMCNVQCAMCNVQCTMWNIMQGQGEHIWCHALLFAVLLLYLVVYNVQFAMYIGICADCSLVQCSPGAFDPTVDRIKVTFSSGESLCAVQCSVKSSAKVAIGQSPLFSKLCCRVLHIWHTHCRQSIHWASTTFGCNPHCPLINVH